MRHLTVFLACVILFTVVTSAKKSIKQKTITKRHGTPTVDVTAAKRNLLPSLQQAVLDDQNDITKKSRLLSGKSGKTPTSRDGRGLETNAQKTGDDIAKKRSGTTAKPSKAKGVVKAKTVATKNKTKKIQKGQQTMKNTPHNKLPTKNPAFHKKDLLKNIGQRLNLINKIESKIKTAYNINNTKSAATSKPSQSTKVPSVKNIAAVPTAGKNQKIMVLISKNGNMISLNRFKRLQSKGLVKGITPVYVRDAHGNILFAVPVARKLKNKNYMLSKKLMMVSNAELQDFLRKYKLTLPAAISAVSQMHRQLGSYQPTVSSSQKPAINQSYLSSFASQVATPKAFQMNNFQLKKLALQQAKQQKLVKPITQIQYSKVAKQQQKAKKQSQKALNQKSKSILDAIKNKHKKLPPLQEKASKKNITMTELQIGDKEYSVLDSSTESASVSNSTKEDPAVTKELQETEEQKPLKSLGKTDEEVEDKILQMEAFYKEHNQTSTEPNNHDETMASESNTPDVKSKSETRSKNVETSPTTSAGNKESKSENKESMSINESSDTQEATNISIADIGGATASIAPLDTSNTTSQRNETSSESSPVDTATLTQNSDKKKVDSPNNNSTATKETSEIHENAKAKETSSINQGDEYSNQTTIDVSTEETDSPGTSFTGSNDTLKGISNQNDDVFEVKDYTDEDPEEVSVSSSDASPTPNVDDSTSTETASSEPKHPIDALDDLPSDVTNTNKAKSESASEHDAKLSDEFSDNSQVGNATSLAIKEKVQPASAPLSNQTSSVASFTPTKTPATIEKAVHEEADSRDSFKEREEAKEKEMQEKAKKQKEIEEESQQGKSSPDYQQTQCRPCTNPLDISMQINKQSDPYPSPVFTTNGHHPRVIPMGNLNLLPCCKDSIANETTMTSTQDNTMAYTQTVSQDSAQNANQVAPASSVASLTPAVAQSETAYAQQQASTTSAAAQPQQQQSVSSATLSNPLTTSAENVPQQTPIVQQYQQPDSASQATSKSDLQQATSNGQPAATAAQQTPLTQGTPQDLFMQTEIHPLWSTDNQGNRVLTFSQPETTVTQQPKGTVEKAPVQQSQQHQPASAYYQQPSTEDAKQQSAPAAQASQYTADQQQQVATAYANSQDQGRAPYPNIDGQTYPQQATSQGYQQQWAKPNQQQSSNDAPNAPQTPQNSIANSVSTLQRPSVNTMPNSQQQPPQQPLPQAIPVNSPQQTPQPEDTSDDHHYKYPIKDLEFDDDAIEDDDEAEVELKEKSKAKPIQKPKHQSKETTKIDKKHQSATTRHTPTKPLSKKNVKHSKEKLAYIKELSAILKESQELSKALQDQAKDYVKGKSEINNKTKSAAKPQKMANKAPLQPAHVSSGQVPSSLAGFEKVVSTIKTAEDQMIQHDRDVQAYYQNYRNFVDDYHNNPSFYQPKLYQNPHPFNYDAQKYNEAAKQYYASQTQNGLSGQSPQDTFTRVPNVVSSYASQTPQQQPSTYYQQPQTTYTQPIISQMYGQQPQQPQPQQQQQASTTKSFDRSLSTVSIANDKSMGLESVKKSPTAAPVLTAYSSPVSSANPAPITSAYTAPIVSAYTAYQGQDLLAASGNLKSAEEDSATGHYPSPKINLQYAQPKQMINQAFQGQQQAPQDPIAKWSRPVSRDNIKPQQQQGQKIQQHQKLSKFSKAKYFINNGISDVSHHEKALDFLSSFMKHISSITHDPQFWNQQSQRQSSSDSSKRDVVLGPVVDEIERESKNGALGSLVGRIFDDDDGVDEVGTKKDDIMGYRKDDIMGYRRRNDFTNDEPLESGIITMLQTDDDEKAVLDSDMSSLIKSQKLGNADLDNLISMNTGKITPPINGRQFLATDVTIHSNLIKPRNEDSLRNEASPSAGDILVGRIVPIKDTTSSRRTISSSTDFPTFPSFPDLNGQEIPDPNTQVSFDGGLPENPEAESNFINNEIMNSDKAAMESNQASQKTRFPSNEPSSSESTSKLPDVFFQTEGAPFGQPIGQPIGLPDTSPSKNFYDTASSVDEIKSNPSNGDLAQESSPPLDNVNMYKDDTGADTGGNIKSILQSQNQNDELTKSLLFNGPQLTNALANAETDQYKVNYGDYADKTGDARTNTPLQQTPGSSTIPLSSGDNLSSSDSRTNTPLQQTPGSSTTPLNTGHNLSSSDSSSASLETKLNEIDGRSNAASSSPAASNNTASLTRDNTSTQPSADNNTAPEEQVSTQTPLKAEEAATPNSATNITFPETPSTLDSSVKPLDNLTNTTEVKGNNDLTQTPVLINETITHTKLSPSNETALIANISTEASKETPKPDASIDTSSNQPLDTTNDTKYDGNFLRIPNKANSTILDDSSPSDVHSSGVAVKENSTLANDMASSIDKPKLHFKKNLTAEIAMLQAVLDLAEHKMTAMKKHKLVHNSSISSEEKVKTEESLPLNALNRTLLEIKPMESPLKADEGARETPKSSENDFSKNSFGIAVTESESAVSRNSHEKPTKKSTSEFFKSSEKEENLKFKNDSFIGSLETPDEEPGKLHMIDTGSNPLSVKNFTEDKENKPTENAMARAILTSINDDRKNRTLNSSLEDVSTSEKAKEEDLVILNGDQMFKIKNASSANEQTNPTDSVLNVNVYFNGKGKDDIKRYSTDNPERVSLRLNKTVETDDSNGGKTEKSTDNFVPRKVSLLMEDGKKSTRSNILKYIKMGSDGSVSIKNIRTDTTASVRSHPHPHSEMSPEDHIKEAHLLEAKHLMETMKKHEYADALLKKKLGILNMLNELSGEKIENVMAKFNEYKYKLKTIADVPHRDFGIVKNLTALRSNTTDTENKTSPGMSDEINAPTEPDHQSLSSISASYEAAKKALRKALQRQKFHQENINEEKLSTKEASVDNNDVFANSSTHNEVKDQRWKAHNSQIKTLPIESHKKEETEKVKVEPILPTNETSSSFVKNVTEARIEREKKILMAANEILSRYPNTTTASDVDDKNKIVESIAGSLKKKEDVTSDVQQNHTQLSDVKSNLNFTPTNVKESSNTSTTTTAKSDSFSSSNSKDVPKTSLVKSDPKDASSITSKSTESESTDVSAITSVKPDSSSNSIVSMKSGQRDVPATTSANSADSKEQPAQVISKSDQNLINLNSTVTNVTSSLKSNTNETNASLNEHNNSTIFKSDINPKSSAPDNTKSNNSTKPETNPKKKLNPTKSMISQANITVVKTQASGNDPYSELGDSTAGGVMSDGNGNYHEAHNPYAKPMNGMVTSNAKIKRTKLSKRDKRTHDKKGRTIKRAARKWKIEKRGKLKIHSKG
ncbi:serine-rich adhesin for platelets-like [Clytia hemisphaerica]|uniref:serine-rich adhesin for platelets-like n=1 Tax=Clytia hemisphaerica TaxID=252671 RepID=UPI0034D55C78